MAAGFKKEYDALWGDGKNIDEVLEVDLINLVNQAISQDRKKEKEQRQIPTYDAILVDEGQDFNLDWWNTLRKVRRDKGEMLLVADETQDLYQRAKDWTEESMAGAGFVGPWTRLDISYRMPPTLINYLEKYAKQYLPNISINIPEAETSELDIWPVQMRWVQLNPNVQAVRFCADAVLSMPIWTQPETLAYSDITLLVQDHKFGWQSIELLERSNVKTAHVFGNDRIEQKHRKLGFFMGDARAKATTIHSFKGWESRCMVIHISRANLPEDLATIYVALSRLKRHTVGSYLTVICSAPELEVFGKTWQTFERL